MRGRLAVAIVAAAGVAGPAARGEPDVVLAARLRALECYVSDDDQRALLPAVESYLLRELRAAADVVDDGRRVVRALAAPGFQLDIRALGLDGAVAAIGFGCGTMNHDAETTLLSLRREPKGWRVVARSHLEPPGYYWIVATSVIHPRLALMREIQGTQATSVVLELRGADLVVEQQVDDVYDATVKARRAGAAIRWTRVPRHFYTWFFEDTKLIQEDVVVDLDRPGPAAITRTSTKPWLDALDAACDAPTAGVPCETTILSDRAIPGGRELVAETADLACDVVGAPPVIAHPGGAVVTMTSAARGWRIAQVRPADRLCAIHGTRLVPPRPSTAGRAVAVPGPAHGLAASAGELLIATRVDIVRARAGRVTTAAADVAGVQDVAVHGRAITWIVGGDAEVGAGEIVVLRDGHEEVIAEDFEATALATCGPDLCWSAYDAGEIRRWRRGAVDVVAAGLDRPLGLAWDGTRLVAATAGGIVTVPLTGGPPQPLAAADAPTDVAADRSRLAWLEADGRIVVVRGGKRHTVAPGGRPSSLAFLGRDLIWVDAATGLVRRLPAP